MGEERRYAARVHEDHAFVAAERAVAHEVDKAGHRLAGVGEIEQDAFRARHGMHCVPARGGGYAVASAIILFAHVNFVRS